MLNPVNINRTRNEIVRLRSVLTTSTGFGGDERRFNGIVPFKENLFGHKVILSRHIRWRQMIYFIQANRITCSIHLSSDNIKARATLVSLNGRGMACVFGRRGQGVTTGATAYAELLMTLKETDCTFNMTLLDPAVAYGLSAMLYGEKGSKTMDSPRIAFLGSLEEMKANGKAGCVQVVNKNEEVIVTAFVYDGKTHSYMSTRPDVRCGRTAGIAISASRGAQCRWWCLSQEQLDHDLMFDLTGLEKMLRRTALTGLMKDVESPVDAAENRERVRHYESTEAFLEQFFNKPSLRDTLLFDNYSIKEMHALDIRLVYQAIFRKSVDKFSHYINPFWAGAS